MSREVTEFVIYIINEISNIRDICPSRIYAVLDRTGCIKNYLVPFYDVLHSLSSHQVVEDVIEYIGSRGEAL